MDKNLIKSAKAFLQWFDDNFADQKCLNDEGYWISYCELPVYYELEKAIGESEKQ